MVKIAISGLTGTGKTTTAERIAGELDIPHICFSMKEEARARGISIVDLQSIAAEDDNIDKEFDRRQGEEMERHSSFITSTWLGPWFANADLNVWLYAEDSVRARRVAERDGLSYEEAFKMMIVKDKQNNERYLKLYGINIADINKFHVCINTSNMPVEKVCSVVTSVLGIMR